MTNASRPEQPDLLTEDDERRSACLRALRLPEPLARVLKSPVESRDFARSWRRIEAQLDAVQPSLPVIMENKRRMWAACAVILGMSATLVVLGWAVGWRTPAVYVEGSREPVGPVAASAHVAEPTAPKLHQEAPPEPMNARLRLVDGASFNGVDATSGSVAVTFEDGSTLLVQKHGSVEPLVMNERDVVLRLKVGAVDVSVVPGGSRRWVVQAGAVSVEVVGTQFTMNRTDDQVAVRVTRGSVLVRSEHLPERVERLRASEALTVITSSDTASPIRSNRLTRPGTVQAGGVSTLLEQADQARLRADWSTARRALERVVKDFSKDPRAPVAAYQLAMVRQRQDASPLALVDAFARALNMASGASMRQDCYWRLLQAQIAAGQGEAAAQTARSALDEFPQGRYSERLRAHLAEGEDE